MGSDLARSRDARRRAQDILIEIALAAGERADDFVVIGGLNPDFLAIDAPTPHLGTTDVDLLVELGMVFDRDELDFGWIDSVLSAARPGANSWQWRARADPGIAIELLCDESDSPGLPIGLPGSSARALNVRGTAPARFAPIVRRLDVPDHLAVAGTSAVELKFAGLGGYLLTKAAAYQSRALPKDAYDFAYVALHCEGGVAAAAAALQRWLDQGFAATHTEALSATIEDFIGPRRIAAGYYAVSMLEAGSEDDEATLVEDAVSAAESLRSILG